MRVHADNAAFELDVLRPDVIRLAFGTSDAPPTPAVVADLAAFSAPHEVEETDAGLIVIASFISPSRRDRATVRASLGPGEFVEVYVKASVAAAERRDPKGLYRKARAGEIKGFTGIDDPYEEPERAEVVLETETTPPDEAARQVLAYLAEREYLQA